VQCPKCRKVGLTESVLSDSLPVQCCAECEGNWIPTENYEVWQNQQAEKALPLKALTHKLDVDFQPSPYDDRAALCPQCQRYLSRAKVNLATPFFVERCQDCGIWCDRGEWEMLEKLGLSGNIEKLFSREWQVKVQKAQYSYQERQALINKVGLDLAKQIFELATVLGDHPEGDFALAYLMRRVGDKTQTRPQKSK
jgi:endogenous inhibitor of DNA gyrase (YacG/DUF329 family)